MHKGWENVFIFLGGAGGYYAIEIMWRGHSHWTMGVTGGLCLCILYRLSGRMSKRPLVLKAWAGAGIITGIEFIVGCIVNLGLKWNVWDYSNMRFNILGQICPLYFFLWTLLCIPIFPLCGLIQKHIFKHRIT